MKKQNMAENKKEINLSDKIWSEHEIKVKLANDVISVSNVKKFIRLLKEEVCVYRDSTSKDYCGDCSACKIIDKLAGEKLK